MNEVPIERVRELLRYEPMEHGSSLVWKIRSAQRVRVGSPAGYRNNSGYWLVGIDKNMYLAHRVVWVLHYGRWPECQVDHKNINPNDNRIENLRLALNNHADNQQNTKARKNNRNGLLGAHKKGNGWVASITVNRTKKYLGYFKTPQEAHAAYMKAKQLLHPFAVMDNGNNSE